MNLLLDWLVDGLLIATLASLVALVIPSNAPSHRYVYWWFVLTAILAMPLLPTPAASVGAPAVPLGAVLLTPLHTAVVSLPLPRVSPLLSIPQTSSTVIWLVGSLWLGLVVTRGLGLIRSLQRVQRLTDASVVLPAEYVSRFRAFSAAAAGSRPVSLRVTTAFRGACAVGYRRPSVLVSSVLTERLSPEDVEAVVLHEYAHLQRYDDWACLAQAVIRATVGLHPAVWWVMRQLDVEREAACDRHVVQQTQSPVAYVRALTAAADLSMHDAGAMLQLAPGLTRGAGGFESRMRRLIEAPLPSRLVTWTGALAASISLVAVVALADRMPPLMAFNEEVPVDATALAHVASSVETQADVVTATSVPSVTDQKTQVPSASRSTETSDARGAQGPAPVERAVAAPVRDVAAAGVDVSSVTFDEQVVAGTAPELAARSLSSSLAPLVERPLAIDAADRGLGSRAAGMGTATGEIASRAGVSIGRFFGRSGRAVAQRF